MARGSIRGRLRVRRSEEKPPEHPLVGYATSGEAELLTVRSVGDGPPSITRRRLRLRRKRPVSLREWARLVGLTCGFIATIAIGEGESRAGLVLLVVAGALIAYWLTAEVDATAAPYFPYERGRRRPGEPVPELPFATVPAAQRAMRAAGFALAVGASWLLSDTSPGGVAAGLAVAGIVATWAAEIPLRPPRWVGIAATAAGGTAAFVVAGVAMALSPLGGQDSALWPALVVFSVFGTCAYVLLSVVLVMHRIDRWDHAATA